MASLVAPSPRGVTEGLVRQVDWSVAGNRSASGQGEPHQGTAPQARYGPRSKKLEYASSERPCRIVLIDLGGRSRVNLQRLVKTLNSRGGELFKFELSTPVVTELDTYDELHCYSDERLFGVLKERIAHTDYAFAIGVTHERLNKQSFNRHNESEGIGAVTVADANEYVPPGRSLEQYLCYLILCEAFCVVGGVHFEHDEVRYCLFDMCLVKEDLVPCLQNPCIHKGCVRDLLDSGFSSADLREANRLLKYVGSTSLSRVISQAVQNPGSTLLLGGLVGYILRGLSAHATQWVFWGVVVELALLIVLCALVKYKLEERRTQVAN